MLPLDFANLQMPRLGLASMRSRFIFRGAFLLLIVATLALALVLLKEEKQRSHQTYTQGFKKTQAEIVAKLRHPSGQLALLNPGRENEPPTPLRPLLLPYAAIDFDDRNKAQQAVEMAGCEIRYAGKGAVCVGIGNNPYAGGYIYIVGNFLSHELVGRKHGELELGGVHRARVTLTLRGRTTSWIAPFEAMGDASAASARGRLTGFIDEGLQLSASARPVRDFRGWLWQGGQCQEAANPQTGCLKPSYFSIRLPVEPFREDLFLKSRPAWPPQDLDRMVVQLEIFAPELVEPIFDSNSSDAVSPFAVSRIPETLQPGETLTIRKLEGAHAQDIITLKGAENPGGPSSPLISKLIQRLPVDGYDRPLVANEIIHTSVGSYEVNLTGNVRGIDRSLSAVATRVSWFVAAMLGAIAVTWLLIEVSFIRRVATLTKRAAAVSHNVQDDRIEQRLAHLDLSDLRGSDEVGILAGSLSDLLQRVKDDVQREHIRAQQKRDMWHAVGHEIMSPLQSLMVLHASPDDASHRYIQRMQQAVRVLYGSASPSEALEAATLQLEPLDLNEFLSNIASNAHFAGLQNVHFDALPEPVMVRADEFSLEDVVTHVLRNADRYRTAGTPISIVLTAADSTASVSIRNHGPAIDPNLIDRIFEYGVSDCGVSDTAANENSEHRGQGLFVAKTYMAKMSGTIHASNVEDGVCFTLVLQRVMN